MVISISIDETCYPSTVLVLSHPLESCVTIQPIKSAHSESLQIAIQTKSQFTKRNRIHLEMPLSPWWNNIEIVFLDLPPEPKKLASERWRGKLLNFQGVSFFFQTCCWFWSHPASGKQYSMQSEGVRSWQPCGIFSVHFCDRDTESRTLCYVFW